MVSCSTAAESLRRRNGKEGSSLNERLRSMLQRDFLTAPEIEHLSKAKRSLLEAAEVHLGILKGKEE